MMLGYVLGCEVERVAEGRWGWQWRELCLVRLGRSEDKGERDK